MVQVTAERRDGAVALFRVPRLPALCKLKKPGGVAALREGQRGVVGKVQGEARRREKGLESWSQERERKKKATHVGSSKSFLTSVYQLYPYTVFL